MTWNQLTKMFSFQIPITVTWHKQDGNLPPRAYQEHGVLTISNVQHSDSGIYVCQAQSGADSVEEKVTITVGGKKKPNLFNSIL